MTLKPRDYRDTAAAVKSNLQTHIDMHPDAFEVLLFVPDYSTAETVAENADVVGALDLDERHMEYRDPIEARAVRVRLPSPFAMGLVDDGGDENDGQTDEPILLLLSENDVPKQTVIQFEEYVNQDEAVIVNYYVQNSEAIGSAPHIWKKHFCVPFRAFGDGERNTP